MRQRLQPEAGLRGARALTGHRCRLVKFGGGMSATLWCIPPSLLFVLRCAW